MLGDVAVAAGATFSDWRGDSRGNELALVGRVRHRCQFEDGVGQETGEGSLSLP